MTSATCKTIEKANEVRERRFDVDLVVTPDEALVVVDLPGVDRDGIDVQVEQGLLSIRARRGLARSEGARALLTEIDEGGFSRRYRIGEGVDPAAIRAEYLHGVLTVSLPRQDRGKSRSVPVTLGD